MSTPKPGVKKDSTNEVPMHDLGEIVAFIISIHEKGLETASMPDVAKGSGYRHPTSTPFYRKMTAGRLFGLLSKTGAELTPRARDYLKPDIDGARERALTEAINSVSAYADLLQKFNGKKLNSDLVANGLSKSLNLTDACATICGRAFEASLKFAGLLSADGTVSGFPRASAVAQAKQETCKVEDGEGEEEIADTNEIQKHTLYLDKTKAKKFTVTAPIAITSAEIKRIQKWIEVTLLIELDESNQGGST